MAKNHAIEVDEDMLRQTMLNDVPVMKKSGAADASMTLPALKSKSGEIRDEPERESKQSRRGPSRPRKQKEEGLNYRDIFLVNDGGRARVSAYINRDVHEKFKRLLSIVAPDVTISSFINNVLNHHLEQYRDEISEMYNNEFDKPF